VTAYYNETEPYAAAWLRNLIAAGFLPPGEVDERSVADVRPGDLAGYRQCHFFAGLGGWAYAARLAGWPDARPLWTGSCPCQPFSRAGRRGGLADARHLWPAFFRLVRAHRPAVVMGEQVAAAIGGAWLDGVFADLEGVGYACRAVVVPACAVDAPHRRDRLWFVAATPADGAVAQPGGAGLPLPEQRREPGQAQRELSPRPAASERSGACRAGMPGWRGARWLAGADGRMRRLEPGVRLLADGIPGRVPQLRALGNAVVPQVAAEVIAAFMECRS
jgi:DNA (cytosine-5)-methyltransferase 1